MCRSAIFFGIAVLFMIVGSVFVSPAFADDGDTCLQAKGDEAIAACTHIIEWPGATADARAIAYYNRGLAYYDNGDNDRAIADFNEAIRADPKDSDLYFSRGILFFSAGSVTKAQADFKQANELNPKNAYVALWLDLAERRNNFPSQLAETAVQLDKTAWPAPVVRLFLGELTPAQTFAAADDKDPETKQGEVCEANFYIGELRLLQNVKDEALRLFRYAASDCPHDFIEWAAANAELRVLGAVP